MIDEDGNCVSISDERYFHNDTNFTLALARGEDLPGALQNASVQLSAPQRWHFRAGEATYCAATDPTCQYCASKMFWSSYTYVDSRFCVGIGGCVCIFNCEFRCSTRSATLPTPTASSPTATTSSQTAASPQPSTGTYVEKFATEDAIKYGAGSLAVFACVWLSCFLKRSCYGRRSQRQQQTPASPHMRVRLQPPAPGLVASGSPSDSTEVLVARPSGQLKLNGWLSHRQQLIDAEQRRANGYEDRWERLHSPTQARW